MKEMELLPHMNISTSAKYAIGVAAAVALLAGCSGGSPSVPGTTGMTPSTTHDHSGRPLPLMLAMRLTNAAGLAPVIHPNNHKNWMDPDLRRHKHRVLVYSANENENQVDVYPYSSSGTKVKGELTSGIDDPYGLCSDSHGNVWITSFVGAGLTEYAHGATSPTTTLTDTGAAIGCAVDPTTGNVAVSNFDAGSPSGYGDVVVYTNGTGSGTAYAPTDTYLWAPAYDSSGNLYVEGRTSSFTTELLELAKGASSFTTISLPMTIDFPAGVIVDGSYVDALDQEYELGFTTGIYELSISGSTASLVTQWDYTDTCFSGYNYNDLVQGVIHAGKVIGGNLDCGASGLYRTDFWPLDGGNPTRYIDGGAFEDTGYGTALSKK